jgi:hypothetical protein
MLGLYAHINIPNGTYKIYDVSTNDAIQLLMTENKWTLSDFTVEYKHTDDVEMYIQKNELNVVTLKRTPEQMRHLNPGEKAVLVKHTTVYTNIPHGFRDSVRIFTMPTFSVIERIE